jgi:probable HAF family extracellular repeat protein
MKPVLALVLFMALIPTVSRAQPAPIDLGTLGGSQSYTTGINNNGQVVGGTYGVPGDAAIHAFSWRQAAGMVDLGTLGGDSYVDAVNARGEAAGHSNFFPIATLSHAILWTQGGGLVDLGTLGDDPTRALALNDNGQVVGYSDFRHRLLHAFSWTASGGMRDLAGLSDDDVDSYATAVNNAGQVIGDISSPGSYLHHGFVWTEASGVVDLGTLGGSESSAVSLNASGQVVGYSDVTGDVKQHAFSWTATGGMIDLGTLGGSNSRGVAVNANGQVVGCSDVTGDVNWHAFSWTPAGGMIDLGTLGGTESCAVGVNANGQVVGNSRIAGDVATHAFFWTPAGGMVDLGTLGGTSSQATAVNDRGQVVGSSSLAGDKETHAALWNVVVTEVVSVTPGAGSGVRQAFVLEYWDALGATDLALARVRIGAANVSVGSCTVDYDASTGLVRLQDDTSAWGPWTVFGSGTLSNSQCTLHLASSSAAPNDTTLTIVLDLSFTPRFSGTKTIYMRAASATDASAKTDWVARGTWTIPAVEVAPVSVTPDSGSSAIQLFTLTYSDSFGVTTDLSAAQVRIAAGNAAAGSCTVHYNAMTNAVRMQDDGGTWGAWTPLGSGTLGNSQCTLDLAQTSATTADTTLSLALRLAFNASFAGARTIFMKASSSTGPSSGWQPRGTWTVTPAHVEVAAVSPDTGFGVSQLFTLAYADSEGVTTDLSVAQFRIATTSTPEGGCTVHYNAMTGRVRLQKNSGLWGAWTTFGSGVLANSQCSLDLAQSSATASGTTLTLILHLTFTPDFAGARTIFMRATSATGPTTGWLARGTWAVGPLVEAISVMPASGAGATQSFSLAYADSEGATADLKAARVRFASTGLSQCIVDYNAMTGLVRMQDDTGTWLVAVPFGSGSLRNSSCALDLAQSGAAASETSLTLTLHLTFKAAFSGTKTIEMRANSAFGSTTGWVRRGTWEPSSLEATRRISIPANDAISP